MKTYYDVLAAHPNQAQLRADIEFLLQCNRAMDCESVRNEWMDFSFAAYNESQTHILVNVLSADEDKDADDFFTNLKLMPLDFNPGQDFLDWYFDHKTNRVYGIDDESFSDRQTEAV
jgi:hypothetical protein